MRLQRGERTIPETPYILEEVYAEVLVRLFRVRRFGWLRCRKYVLPSQFFCIEP